MKEYLAEIRILLKEIQNYFEAQSEEECSLKPALGKWSKKEILRHLIDSALNNLQRFTEVRFEPKPYLVRNYRQNELVKVNRYNSIENLMLCLEV